jgi:hypothetical protein
MKNLLIEYLFTCENVLKILFYESADCLHCTNVQYVVNQLPMLKGLLQAIDYPELS